MFDPSIFDLNTIIISILFMSRPKNGTHYFDLIIYNDLIFNFWNRIPQNLIISWKYSFLPLNFMSQNKY